jgi:hypothetical protein
MCSSVFATSWSSSSPRTVWPHGQSISFATLPPFLSAVVPCHAAR